MSPLARRMWILYEPYHDVTYFTPESRAATDALGCRGGWMGYFGMRAAPLGAAAPELIAATFYNFHPRRVHRALPDAWAVATPAVYLETRLAGADGALRRMLGDEELRGERIAQAARLAVEAAANAPVAGRPLGAANAVLPLPDEPHLALWQATTTLRESRGDGHVAALVAASLDPCETLVLYAAENDLDPAYMREARSWSLEEWQAAVERLRERGLFDDGLTAEGRELRRWIEERTDAAAEQPWRALGAERSERFAELIGPSALRLSEQNELMRVNPMALSVQKVRAVVA